MEQNLNKRIHEFEREEAVLKEKLSTAEAKIEELTKQHEEDLQKQKEQLEGLSSSQFKDKETIVAENAKLKQQCYELEKENAELSSNYEKDKALWEGKFSFLEQREAQAKQDLAEAQRKFDSTID
jgi:chromosome segregation ATPase